jgi:hypothetical protein
VLKEGRTLREFLAVAEKVYGPAPRIYERQDGMLATLGALRGRPWGEQNPETVARIRAAAQEVIGR